MKFDINKAFRVTVSCMVEYTVEVNGFIEDWCHTEGPVPVLESFETYDWDQARDYVLSLKGLVAVVDYERMVEVWVRNGKVIAMSNLDQSFGVGAVPSELAIVEWTGRERRTREHEEYDYYRPSPVEVYGVRGLV